MEIERKRMSRRDILYGSVVIAGIGLWSASAYMKSKEDQIMDRTERYLRTDGNYQRLLFEQEALKRKRTQIMQGITKASENTIDARNTENMVAEKIYGIKEAEFKNLGGAHSSKYLLAAGSAGILSGMFSLGRKTTKQTKDKP